MLLPLHGFVVGDTIGMIVLVDDQQTVGDLAALVQEAALPRIATGRRRVVHWRGKSLATTTKIADAGIEPLDRIDVGPEEA